MKTEWDYTDLAEAYLKRPDYAQSAIDAMVEKAKLSPAAKICDVGAGAAHLTLMLASKGFEISAVEPNDAMRSNGIKRTSKYPKVKWFEGVGENTGMESNYFDMVSFGSSFNVCNREKALEESYRIMKSQGWFACMWNHRDLSNPLQQQIENIIIKQVPEYSYGSRREDQTDVINKSGLFKKVEYLEGSVEHNISVNDFIEGWKSHGTLQRQSREKFESIIAEISDVVKKLGGGGVIVPYTTRIWMAQRKD